MKIAFYSYPSAFQNPGGGEVQLLKTKEHLEKMGMEVRLFDQWSDKFDDYDVLHIFGSVKDCVGLMKTARNKNMKIALSSIFWSSFKRAMNEGDNLKKKTELFFRHLAKLLFPYLPSGRRKTMVLSDVIFPNSDMEKKQLVRLFGIPSEKIKVVPNGIDNRFLEAKPDKFIEKFKLKDFALAVGRIEPRKNQLNLIKAFNDLKMKLVVIGNPVSDYISYYETCKKEAGDNIIFIDGMRHEDELLEAAYAACSIFVAPGWFETPSLSALEAASAGASIAITKYGCTKEYFGDCAVYFDPSSIADIRDAIKSAKDIDAEKKKRLKACIKDNYLWNNVAAETIKGYESILRGKA
jgi:glycosyltransferase involved in cell wall biosynthesis